MIKTKKRRWVYVVLALMVIVYQLLDMRPRLKAEAIRGEVPPIEAEFVLAAGNKMAVRETERYRLEGGRMTSMGLTMRTSPMEATYSIEVMAKRLEEALDMEHLPLAFWTYTEGEDGYVFYYNDENNTFRIGFFDKQLQLQEAHTVPMPEGHTDGSFFIPGCVLEGRTLYLTTESFLLYGIDLDKGEIVTITGLTVQNRMPREFSMQFRLDSWQKV